ALTMQSCREMSSDKAGRAGKRHNGHGLRPNEATLFRTLSCNMGLTNSHARGCTQLAGYGADRASKICGPAARPAALACRSEGKRTVSRKDDLARDAGCRRDHGRDRCTEFGPGCLIYRAAADDDDNIFLTALVRHRERSYIARADTFDLLDSPLDILGPDIPSADYDEVFAAACDDQLPVK